MDTKPIPWFRCAVGGLLMGLANLVPGVSGGTMILIMGLYDAFISAVADVTRLQFSRRAVLLLGVIVGVAGVSIVSLAGPLRDLVVTQPVAMYALFIGMTLGGAPMLYRMIRPWRPTTLVAMLIGVGLMIGIAATASGKTRLTDEEKAEIKALVERGEFPLAPNYGLDVAAGVVGMSAMVLPGISGAYMLLLLGRYEQVLGAVAAAKEYGMSLGKQGDLAWLHIIVPVALGVIISVICVTNLLKWLLHHHEKPTLAILLGILLGSVVMLFGMVDVQTGRDYGVAAGLVLVGFVLTVILGRIGAGAHNRR